MKPHWLLAVALLQTAAHSAYDPARHLHVERPLHVPPGASGQTCAVLDANVYAHAAGESLNDLRLFASAGAGSGVTDREETPFTLTESNTERAEDEPAAVRNLAMEGDDIVFDLEMPRRPYTGVDLKLDARDFIASATVTGRDREGHNVAGGEFALFDLTAQHLSRSTTLPLQESSLPELHVRLRVKPAPGLPPRRFGSGIVTGATVPPSRFAQTLYTAVAETAAWKLQGHASIAALRLPAHAPVARVEIVLDPAYKANFRRDVTVAARPDRPETADSATSDVEIVNGQISQVHLAPGQDGSASPPPINSLQLGMDAVLAANLRGSAAVQVAVANGNDSPLPLRSVQLEMRQRRICFDANPAKTAYTLLYGDQELPAPLYDYSRLFVPAPHPAEATLGPEQPNPQFVPRADARAFMQRHPDFLWLGLLGALAALGGVALRSLRHQRGESH